VTDEESEEIRAATTGFRPSDSMAGGFVAGLVGTVASRGLLVGLGLLSSVVIARALGPAGRGEFAVATALGAVGLQIANLGIHTSGAWSISRNPALLGPLITNGMLLSGGLGGGLALIVGVVFAAFPGVALLQGPILLIALTSIPVGLANLVLLNLALGLNRVRLFNAMELGQRIVSTAAIVLLILAGIITSTAALACVVVASAASLAVGLVALGRIPAGSRRGSIPLLRASAAYGARAYLAALFTFLVLRLDVLILERLLDDRRVGEYAIAVSIAEFALLGPVTVATLLFPRLAAMADARLRWITAARWALLTGAGAACVMLVAWLLGAELIATLYGSEFSGGAPALMWLLPGIVLLSMQTILMYFYYAIGTPRITILAPFCGFVVNVALNLALIPIFGIVGSALASTLAYAAMLLLTGGHFWFYSRIAPDSKPVTRGS
jgi:O-antigen/teichoic acid export membrane protein